MLLSEGEGGVIQMRVSFGGVRYEAHATGYLLDLAIDVSTNEML